MLSFSSAQLKTYLRIFLPTLLGALSMPLLTMADNIMVSGLDPSNLNFNAAGLASQLCMVPYLFLVGVSNILFPLVASAKVNHDYRSATKALKHVLLINLSTAVASYLFMNVFLRSYLFGGDASTSSGGLTYTYLPLLSLSIFPAAILQPFRRYLASMGMVMHNMVISFLIVGLNIGLNYLLIFGHYGFPVLGLYGAGIATVLSQVVATFVYLGYAYWLYGQGTIVAPWEGLERPYMGFLLRLGAPAGFELTVKMIYGFVVLMITKSVEEESLAAIRLFSELWRISLLAPIASSMTCSILIGRTWKQQEKQAILSYIATGFIGNILITLPILAFFYLRLDLIAGPPLIKITPQAIHLLRPVLGISILTMCLDGFSLVTIGILRGIRDTFFPFAVNIVIYACSAALCYYLGVIQGWGTPGIIYSILAGVTTSLVLLLGRCYYHVHHLSAHTLAQPTSVA